MKKFWIGLTVGALVAGVAVLFYAPQSGLSARKKLKRGFEDLGDNLSDAAEYLKEQAEKLGKEAQRLIDNSTDQLEEAAEAAQSYAKATAAKGTEKVSRLM